MNPQTVAVQQGVWIDRQQLAAAGLGEEVCITVSPGEIRITANRPAAEAARRRRPSPRLQGTEIVGDVMSPVSAEEAWEVFRDLGRRAEPGVLPDSSRHHDRYLYRDPLDRPS